MNGTGANWSDITTKLAQRQVVAPATDAAHFWQDFKARRHLYPQQTPVVRYLFWRPTRWVWTLGSLGVTSLLAIAGWFFFLQAAPVQADFAIHFYEIIPNHGSVMLWQDAESQATILWISDLDLATATSAPETKP